MIVTPRILIRLVLLGIGIAVLQMTLFAKLTFVGASPDISLLVVMALGLLGGSMVGAVSGFSVGLLLDALLVETFAASSLALLAVGYLAGRYRESFGRATLGATAILGGALTLLGVVGFGLIQVMLGVGAEVSALVVRDAILKVLMGTAFAIPVHATVRRMLRPALVEDRPRAARPLATGEVGVSL